MHILIINGPNMNLLGLREPDIYGRMTYPELVTMIRHEAESLGVMTEFLQSNHEGVLVDAIQAARGRFDAIIINPAAYTHTSVALLDALKAVALPAVEVHLSDPDTREPFRKISYLRAACRMAIKGKGAAGYLEALQWLVANVSANVSSLPVAKTGD